MLFHRLALSLLRNILDRGLDPIKGGREEADAEAAVAADADVEVDAPAPEAVAPLTLMLEERRG